MRSSWCLKGGNSARRAQPSRPGVLVNCGRFLGLRVNNLLSDVSLAGNPEFPVLRGVMSDQEVTILLFQFGNELSFGFDCSVTLTPATRTLEHYAHPIHCYLMPGSGMLYNDSLCPIRMSAVRAAAPCFRGCARILPLTKYSPCHRRLCPKVPSYSANS